MNGVDMGNILHSNVACANIIRHISNQMRRQMIQNIVEKKKKFAISIDESTAVSKASTLIVYISFYPDNCLEKVNVFLKLIELTVSYSI